jgi:hypothetical protein
MGRDDQKAPPGPESEAAKEARRRREMYTLISSFNYEGGFDPYYIRDGIGALGLSVYAKLLKPLIKEPFNEAADQAALIRSVDGVELIINNNKNAKHFLATLKIKPDAYMRLAAHHGYSK